MLNSVVLAVTMVICLAMPSSSVEEMVVNIIRMSIQHISHTRANEIGNIVLWSYFLFSG